MENDGADFVPSGEIDGGNGADALAVEDDIFRADAVASSESVPGGVDVGVKIFFRGFTAGDSVAGIIVAEYVAVDL